MNKNSLIRAAVIADLETADTSALVTTYFDGFPSTIEVSSDDSDDSNDELPAVAVSISEGEVTDSDFEEVTWQAVMTIRIYRLSTTNEVDNELDVIGQMIMEAFGPHYRANGLITTCTKSSFQYGRDDVQPWGTLDLNFTIEYSEEV
jgi:hypothetical protein